MFLQVRKSEGLGQQGAERVKKSGQIPDRYFVGRFADKLDIMYGNKEKGQE